jgi:HSP20 family protein
MFERFAEGIDRVFDDMGFGRGWLSSRSSRKQSPWAGLSSDVELWSPAVDVFQRGTELVVHVDLPGMNKEDIKVDVTEEGIAIQGERKREQQEERDGVYRSERSYGSFFRMIPLPEGAITDQARAEFKDGVLEISMPAPPEQVRRGRRIEITDGRRAQAESKIK